METVCMVPIQKIDVLMEDFSNIKKLIESIASDRQQLLEARNTWEIMFEGYDDDPREISDIPEIINWVDQSIEEGIPWFYFMRDPKESFSFLAIMCCYGTRDPECMERVYFEKERILPFIKKNLDNLADFAEQYDIPDEVGCAATDVMMNYITAVISGDMDQNEPDTAAIREKLSKEAAERLITLEKLFGLNPKVRKYFDEGKLYYSYITGGGFLGSIDTIDYDQRYANIVADFEDQTAYLVYHVIERENTIALLFVSNDYNNWLEERPVEAGVMACVVDVDSCENEVGYITLDCFQGALYRRNLKVYSSLPMDIEEGVYLSNEDSEIIERLEILKNAGIITDLDIAKVYQQDNEICCSLCKSIMGEPIGLINRISAQPVYKQLLDLLSEQISKKFYFLMGSTDHELAFLYISDNPAKWEMEKLMLEQKNPLAVVVNVKDMTAGIKQIRYQMLNGGPLMVGEE